MSECVVHQDRSAGETQKQAESQLTESLTPKQMINSEILPDTHGCLAEAAWALVTGKLFCQQSRSLCCTWLGSVSLIPSQGIAPPSERISGTGKALFARSLLRGRDPEAQCGELHLQEGDWAWSL